jgi:predicted DNA-binding protein
MLAVKINNPYIENHLAKLAGEQHKSRQTIVREMLEQQVEDAEDYAAGMAALERIRTGESTVISADEMWKRLELDN